LEESLGICFDHKGNILFTKPVRSEEDKAEFYYECMKYGKDTEPYIESPFAHCMNKCIFYCSFPSYEECRKSCIQFCVEELKENNGNGDEEVLELP